MGVEVIILDLIPILALLDVVVSIVVVLIVILISPVWLLILLRITFSFRLLFPLGLALDILDFLLNIVEKLRFFSVASINLRLGIVDPVLELGLWLRVVSSIGVLVVRFVILVVILFLFVLPVLVFLDDTQWEAINLESS